jgi:hypothetical protein
MDLAVHPFEYPAGSHVRRHGPGGYEDYGSYREWLRDEFSFRCVFCLERELWGVRLGSFDIDHFLPQSVAPELRFDYDNLIYICRRCNSVKSDLDVPDPCKESFADCIRILESGECEYLNGTGELLIDVLNLNESQRVQYRRTITKTLSSLRADEVDEVLPMWLGYPDDLPDLASKRNPTNSRPEGIAQSWFQKRLRNELPTLY